MRSASATTRAVQEKSPPCPTTVVDHLLRIPCSGRAFGRPRRNVIADAAAPRQPVTERTRRSILAARCCVQQSRLTFAFARRRSTIACNGAVRRARPWPRPSVGPRPRDPMASICTRPSGRIWSQNGEDGLLAALLGESGVSVQHVRGDRRRRTVKENCTRALAEGGCAGLLVRSRPAGKVQRRAACGRRQLDVHVSAGDGHGPANVIALLQAKRACRDEPDVVVVDIDGNDFWVLRVDAPRVHPSSPRSSSTTPRFHPVCSGRGATGAVRPGTRPTGTARASTRSSGSCRGAGYQPRRVRFDGGERVLRSGRYRRRRRLSHHSRSDLLYRPQRYRATRARSPVPGRTRLPECSTQSEHADVRDQRRADHRARTRRRRRAHAPRRPRPHRERTSGPRLTLHRADAAAALRSSPRSRGRTRSCSTWSATGCTAVSPARGYAWAGGVFRIDEARGETSAPVPRSRTASPGSSTARSTSRWLTGPDRYRNASCARTGR